VGWNSGWKASPKAQVAKWAADEPARRWGGGRRAGLVRPAAALARKPGQTSAGSLAHRVLAVSRKSTPARKAAGWFVNRSKSLAVV